MFKNTTCLHWTQLGLQNLNPADLLAPPKRWRLLATYVEQQQQINIKIQKEPNITQQTSSSQDYTISDNSVKERVKTELRFTSYDFSKIRTGLKRLSINEIMLLGIF